MRSATVITGEVVLADQPDEGEVSWAMLSELSVDKLEWRINERRGLREFRNSPESPEVDPGKAEAEISARNKVQLEEISQMRMVLQKLEHKLEIVRRIVN